MGKFVIKQATNGYKFDLKATNGQTVATSEVYSTKAAAIAGAESVAKAAPEAKLADLTVGGEAITAETMDLEIPLEDLLREIAQLPGVIKADVLAG